MDTNSYSRESEPAGSGGLGRWQPMAVETTTLPWPGNWSYDSTRTRAERLTHKLRRYLNLCVMFCIPSPGWNSHSVKMIIKFDDNICIILSPKPSEQKVESSQPCCRNTSISSKFPLPSKDKWAWGGDILWSLEWIINARAVCWRWGRGGESIPHFPTLV